MDVRDNDRKIAYLRPVGILMITCILMYTSVRWILMQDGDHTWLQGNIVSRISYLISCGGLITAAVVISVLKSRIRIEYLFLVLYLVLEIMYMCVIPLSSTPDETEHMLRAYGITLGDIVPGTNEKGEGGSYVPDNINYMWNRGGSTIKDMRDNLTMEANENRTFMTYSNTALYSPLTYAPQAAGILAGRLICNKPYVWAYMGRIFNMITVGILIFLSIRIAPVGKNIIFTLSMLPINMYECASLSGGALAYAVTVLIIAYTLWLRYVKTGEMNRREKLWLYLLLLFSASCKIVYVPFVLMAFIIPVERFGDKKKYYFHIACASVMILLASVGWVSISSRYLIEYTTGVDSAAQAKFVLLHPLNYLQTIVNTIMQVGEWIIRTFFAGALGYFDVGGSLVMILVSAINLIYVCVREKLSIAGDRKIVMSMLFISTVISCLLILTSEYVQWTAYMNPSIDGLQGRYFLPLVLPFLLMIKQKSPAAKEAEKISGADIIPFSKVLICFVNLMTVVTLFVHYI